jgi:hypothetical protein
MKAKKRIEDLERRVRDLEARQYWPTIVIQPAPVLSPQILPWYPWAPAPLPYAEPYWYTVTSTTTVIS